MSQLRTDAKWNEDYTWPGGGAEKKRAPILDSTYANIIPTDLSTFRCKMGR